MGEPRTIPTLALSPDEAAIALGCSGSTMRMYMREEGLPYTRVRGRVYIRVDALQRWLEERREAPTDEVGTTLRLVAQRRHGVQGP